MKKVNQYRKQIVFLFAAVAMITYLSVMMLPDKSDQKLVIADGSTPMVQVYMPDQDQTLVPLSIPVDADLSLQDKLKTMVSYMNQNHEKGAFRKMFQKNAVLKSVDVKDGKATLNFNKQFASYKKAEELRVIESLVWGATQFSEVKQVAFAIDGSLLTEMPVAKTPITDHMNRSLGINNFETASAELFNTQPLTVFYTKQIRDDVYYVPKTNRIKADQVSINDQVQAVLADISVSSGLEQPLFADQVQMSKEAYMEGNTLVVNLNQNILSEDRAAKQEAYETLVLSLATIVGVDKVKVCVDDVVVSLHGSNEEAVSVSSLSYNRTAF